MERRAILQGMDLRELLTSPGVLSANPERYDYIHSLRIEEGGIVRMVDGGGQALRRELIGRLRLLRATADEAEVLLCELRDVDPYGRSQEVRPVEDLLLTARVEAGPFVLRCEVVWRVTEEDAPWLLYDHRVAFSEDPLAAGTPKMVWPPEFLAHPEGRAFVDDLTKAQDRARRYYADGVELPYRELLRRGLPPEAIIP